MLPWLALAGPRHLHSRDYIHGDLRSPNLFVTSDGGIKIGDFGCARLLAPKLKEVRSSRRTVHRVF